MADPNKPLPISSHPHPRPDPQTAPTAVVSPPVATVPIRSRAIMADQTSGQAQAQTDDQQQVGNGGVQAGTQGPATQTGPAQTLAHKHLTWLDDNIWGDKVSPGATELTATLALKIGRQQAYPDLPKQDAAYDPAPQKSLVQLVQNDTLGAALELHRRYPNDRIAVLNLANPTRPGGGFLAGAVAQEEDLCLQSTLYHALKDKRYPLAEDDIIYSPNVYVVKEKVAGVPGGRLLADADRFFVDVISCAAVSGPRIRKDWVVDDDGDEVFGDTYANQAQQTLMEDKVRWIINAAVHNGVQRLVLGAFGCGVFRNPVHEVATMMKNVLVDDGDNGPEVDLAYYGLMEVVIAIYDTAPGQPVWNAFMDVFRTGQRFHKKIPPPSRRIQYTMFAEDYVAE